MKEKCAPRAFSAKHRLAITGLVVGLGLLVFIISQMRPQAIAPTAAKASAITRKSAPLPPQLTPEAISFLPLTQRLNHPQVPAAQDVQTVFSICDSYFTMLKAHEGPPIRDDADLVKALSGKNPTKLIFLPADHPAISPQGRLLDRWGTPYFIHQRKSRFFEIRSAGPDQKMFTPDDFLAPPPQPERGE